MFLPFNRMIVGQPIHYYYYPYEHSPPLVESSFHQYFPHSMDHNEDYPMITSPSNSTQSDSDNSVSSIEVPSHSIEIPKKEEKKQCLWKNCGVIFQSLTELANHVSQCHSAGGPDGLFHCGWEGCSRNNKGFNARYKMLVHVRTHTNEKPHKCFQCDKSFSRAENLKIHSRSHSGEKPYICPVPGCGKAYSNSSDRFKHTRTHSVEKPYRCKVSGCPKRYTDPSSLRKHVKTYKHFASESINHMEVNLDVSSKRQETKENRSYFEAHVENRVSVITAVNNVKNSDSYHKESPTNAPSDEDIIRFKAVIDIKDDRYGFVERYESKKLYRPYELDDEKVSMDVDRPLDLSIRRDI
ncbi:zinc finger protein GLIS2 homolog isoform X1 [Euwallacea similis]|uniref:zinc finger protein GLIS2 homolog isoform X1 n=2 Tax=Euwallacea similis TaxID=1736056 RepID=UPI00344B161B